MVGRPRREVAKKDFLKLPPEEQEEVLQSLPPVTRLAGLSAQQIRQYLDRLTASRGGRSKGAAK